MKRRICSYDMAAVPEASYMLKDAMSVRFTFRAECDGDEPPLFGLS